jgi:hypothetical protein
MELRRGLIVRDETRHWGAALMAGPRAGHEGPVKPQDAALEARHRGLVRPHLGFTACRLATALLAGDRRRFRIGRR